MRLILCLSVLLASSAWAADEAADRAAIEKVVSTLNNSPDTPGLFTDDFSDNGVLTGLGVYRYRVPIVTTDTAQASTPEGQPAIHLDAISMCVSHQPMGELGPCRAADRVPGSAPRFVIQSIRLLTPDVALVDAVNSPELTGVSRRSPVLMALRKEGDVWKIASVREMAPPRPSVIH
jgi:hypothetical protein